MTVNPDFTEKFGGVLLGSHDGYIIIVFKYKISIGNENFIAPFNGTHKNITFKMFGNIKNAKSVKTKFGFDFKFQKFCPSFGKSIDFNCGRKTQNFGDFHGCGQLRINNHGNAQFFLNKTDFLTV